MFRVNTSDLEAVQNAYQQVSDVVTLYELNQEERYDPDIYLRVKNNFLRDSNDDAIPFPVRAYVDNESDSRFTVIEIQAIDRIALLHDLLHTINQHGLDTIHARIATEKGAALDTFYVQTSDNGDKLSEPERITALQKSLEEVILPPVKI